MYWKGLVSFILRQAQGDIFGRNQMNDHVIFEGVVRLSRVNVPCALATVVQESGSTPRKTGAEMLVRNDRRTIRATLKP